MTGRLTAVIAAGLLLVGLGAGATVGARPAPAKDDGATTVEKSDPPLRSAIGRLSAEWRSIRAGTNRKSAKATASRGDLLALASVRAQRTSAKLLLRSSRRAYARSWSALRGQSGTRLASARGMSGRGWQRFAREMRRSLRNTRG
jgi:hypothetical protein